MIWYGEKDAQICGYQHSDISLGPELAVNGMWTRINDDVVYVG